MGLHILSPQREFEVIVQFGDTYWKLFKFIVNEISKDLYLIFPIPEVGLKLSIHSPKPLMFLNRHAHWSSHKLGFHEDIDFSFFSPEYLKESAMEFLESFRYCQPSSDEDVIVLQTNFLTDASKKETLRRKERTIIDFGRLIQTMCKGTFYQTKAKKLPLLIREMERKNPSLDLRKDLNICALSEGRMIIPLSSKTMIEFDHLTFMEKLRGSSFDSLFNPMQRAIETISRTNPSAFQKWLPTSHIEGFFEETLNGLKQSEPKIVNF